MAISLIKLLSTNSICLKAQLGHRDTSSVVRTNETTCAAPRFPFRTPYSEGGSAEPPLQGSIQDYSAKLINPAQQANNAVGSGIVYRRTFGYYPELAYHVTLLSRTTNIVQVISAEICILPGV